MGQQQLLLLVLGVIIVGLAVVVGIQAFSENQKSANQDALINDAVRIASDIQAQAQKPAQFGGAGSFSNLTVGADGNAGFVRLGYVDSGTTYSNLNGTYTLSGDGSTGVNIEGTSTDADGGTQNQICVTVTGTDPSLIETATGACGSTTTTTA